MVEEIEVKRKVFTIVEQLGEHSFKVERKGQFFFLKKFESDPAKFEAFCDAEHHLRVSGIVSPKCYLYDKKTRIAVLEYVEGESCFETLQKGELPEQVIEALFKTFWYARNDRLGLDYRPENFVFTNGKLYYMPFAVGKFDNKDSFVQNDTRLWFFTKEFDWLTRALTVVLPLPEVLSSTHQSFLAVFTSPISIVQSSLPMIRSLS